MYSSSVVPSNWGFSEQNIWRRRPGEVTGSCQQPVYTLQCTLYIVQCTLYTAHFTHSTVYSVHCTLYTLYNRSLCSLTWPAVVSEKSAPSRPLHCKMDITYCKVKAVCLILCDPYWPWKCFYLNYFPVPGPWEQQKKLHTPGSDLNDGPRRLLIDLMLRGGGGEEVRSRFLPEKETRSFLWAGTSPSQPTWTVRTTTTVLTILMS